MDAFGVIASRVTGSVQALGGGGLAHLIVRFFIWHEIWRFIRLIWRIQTFGPWVIGLIIAVIIGLIVWRRQRGRRPRRGTSTDTGTGNGNGGGTGPRDW